MKFNRFLPGATLLSDFFRDCPRFSRAVVFYEMQSEKHSRPAIGSSSVRRRTRTIRRKPSSICYSIAITHFYPRIRGVRCFSCQSSPRSPAWRKTACGNIPAVGSTEAVQSFGSQQTRVPRIRQSARSEPGLTSRSPYTERGLKQQENPAPPLRTPNRLDHAPVEPNPPTSPGPRPGLRQRANIR